MFLSSVYDKLITAEKRGIPVFGDFCTESQKEHIRLLFKSGLKDGDFVSKILNSERKMPALNFEFIAPASDILIIDGAEDSGISHRDVLGSLMNLGIKRCKIGDIITGTQVFAEVKSEITAYIIQNLTKIRNRNVKAEVYEGSVERIYEFEEIPLTVSSLRADCIIGGLVKLSRENAKAAILSGRISVNARPLENPSKCLSEGDVISVRGSGKYLFFSVNGATKKDRLKIVIKKYI